MKQLINILLILAVITPMAAQPTQSGYVKTKGRMDSKGNLIPGTRIGGAAITLAGGHSTVADANGNFKLTVPDKKYYLQNVQKQGYVLTDPDILSKQYVCSANPLAISMETPQQQMRDQIEAQKKIEATLRKQLAQREKELEALRKAHKLTEEDYYRKLQQLYDEKATQELVKEMSKRYSEIDYDLIDSFQRQFSIYILNGELAKADSLLKTKGNLTGDIKELHRLETANAVERAELERRRARLDTSVAYAQWLMEDIAVRCYNKAEIFKLRYMNDSAAYYLELRAGLDTTNVEWQTETGEFNLVVIADYTKAMECYQRALRQAKLQKGKKSLDAGDGYSDIGRVYSSLGLHSQAIDCFEKAIEIYSTVENKNDGKIAYCYIEIGKSLEDQEQLSMASLFYQKSSVILDSIISANPSDANNYRILESLYNSLGGICVRQEEYNKAVEYFQLAIALVNIIYGLNDSYHHAIVYYNIGLAYKNLEEYDLAEEYYQKALAVFSKLLGEHHPFVATVLQGIGGLWLGRGEPNQALEYYRRALSINMEFFGEQHPDIADNYYSIGQVFIKDSPSIALSNFKEALDIYIVSQGDSSRSVAICYSKLGFCAMKIGDSLSPNYLMSDTALLRLTLLKRKQSYEDAIDYCLKSIAIWESIEGDNNDDIEIALYNIILSYCELLDTKKARKYLKKYMSLQKEIKRSASSDLAEQYIDIGDANYYVEKYVTALRYYRMALRILQKQSADESELEYVYESIAYVYKAQGRYSKYFKYLRTKKI